MVLIWVMAHLAELDRPIFRCLLHTPHTPPPSQYTHIKWSRADDWKRKDMQVLVECTIVFIITLCFILCYFLKSPFSGIKYFLFFIVVNEMHVFFVTSCDLIFFVQGGYMTLGPTFPAPINRFWYPVDVISRLIIHCFTVSLALFLSRPLRRETLPLPSLWLRRHPVCQSQVPPGAPPPRTSERLHHIRLLLWPHPFFWPQRGSWEDGRRHLCPTGRPP